MSDYRFFDPKYDEFLEHSGVPGMKWGVRNYQYTDGTWTELGKERRRIGDRTRGTSSNYTSQKSIQYRKTKEREFIDSIRDDVHAVNKSIFPDGPLDEMARRLNPLRHNNCAFASIAYELRRRKDSKAKAKLSYIGAPLNRMPEIFGQNKWNGTKINGGTTLNNKAIELIRKFNVDSPLDLTDEQRKVLFSTTYSNKEIRSIERELISQGDGARGLAQVMWADGKEGNCHTYNYVVANGSIYTIDCQKENVFRGLGVYLDSSVQFGYIRTDNADINQELLNKFLRKDWQ